MRPIIAALAALALWISGGSALAACDQDLMDVGGYELWMRAAGEGPVTVVFESGGGEDSSAWVNIEPAIRALGVRTVIYDRAGLGRSDVAPAPYSVEQEAGALSTALTACGVGGPIVMASHSYGSFITALAAEGDGRVAGVVLIDANIAEYFDEAAALRVVARYSPQFDALRTAAPELARVLIPVIEAYPDSARSVRDAPFSPTLPIIDIIAEESWAETPQELEAMHAAHAAFVAASPAREAVFADGSGHNVMHDRPDVVVGAITRMIERVTPD